MLGLNVEEEIQRIAHKCTKNIKGKKNNNKGGHYELRLIDINEGKGPCAEKDAKV